MSKKKLAGSAGHNLIISGAHGYIKEEVENRIVLDAVEKYIKQAGWDFADCTDNVGKTARQIILNSVAKHLKHPDAECDIQLHFNAVKTMAQALGVEVWISFSKSREKDKVRAKRIVDQLAKALGLPNRGVKNADNRFGQGVPILWNAQTHYGILVEICFVDSKADTDAYKKLGADGVGKVIAEAIVGEAIAKPEPVKPPVVEKKRIYRVFIEDKQIGTFSDYKNVEALVDKHEGKDIRIDAVDL